MNEDKFLSIEEQEEINSRHTIRRVPTDNMKLSKREYDLFLTTCEKAFEDAVRICILKKYIRTTHIRGKENETD